MQKVTANSAKELVFSILLIPVAMAAKNISLEITGFNHSQVNLSCQHEYDGNVTVNYFYVSRGRISCLHTENMKCKEVFNNKKKCNMSCIGPEGPKSVQFAVTPDGTCNETVHVVCRIYTEMSKLDHSIKFKSLGNPPVISVNNGQPIEASYKPVHIKCTVTNLCYKANVQIHISGGNLVNVHTTPLKTSHSEHGTRFNTTANLTAILSSAGNYTIICKERAKKEDYFSTRLPLVVYDKGELEEPETASDDSYTTGIVAVGLFVILALIACLAIMLERQRRNRKKTLDIERYGDDSRRPLLLDGATTAESSDRYKKIEENISKWNYTKISQELSEGDISFPEQRHSIIIQLFKNFQGASGLKEDLFLELVKKLTPSYKKSEVSKEEDVLLSAMIWEQLQQISIDGESTKTDCIKKLEVFLPLVDGLSSRFLCKLMTHCDEGDINDYLVKVLTFLIQNGADPFQKIVPYNRSGNKVLFCYFVENFGQNLDHVLRPSVAVLSFLEQIFKKLEVPKTGKSLLNNIIKLFSSKSFQGDYDPSSIIELIVRNCLEIIETHPDFCGHVDFERRTPLHNIMEKLFLNGLWKRIPDFAERKTNTLWHLISQLVSEKNVNIRDDDQVTPYSWILMCQKSVTLHNEPDKQKLAKMKKDFQNKGASEEDADDGVGICRYRIIKEKIQHLTKSNLEQQTEDIMEILKEGGVTYPKEGHYIVKKLIGETKHFYRDPSFTKLVQGLYSSYQLYQASRNIQASDRDMFIDIWELFISLWRDNQTTTDNCIAKLKIFLHLDAGFSTRLLCRFIVHDEKSKKKLIRNSHFVHVLEFLVENGADPFSPNHGTTAFTLILEESAFYLQETTLQSAIVSFCQTSMEWAAKQTNESTLNDVIKSVPITIHGESSCHISSIKEIIVERCLGMIDQNPSLRDHADNKGKTPIHNLMEKLLTDDAWQDMSKLTEGTDSLWELMSELITTTNVNIKDKNNVTPYSWLSYWNINLKTLWNASVSGNLSTKINNISKLMKDANTRDALQGLKHIREKQNKKNILRPKNFIYGIGTENNIVEIISSFIERGHNPRKVHKAEIEKLNHLQEYSNYIGHFAVVSSQSLKNHNFCVYLMSVLRCLASSTLRNKSIFVLVVVDRDAVSLLDNAQDKTIHWPIDLQDIPRVDACSQLDDEILNRILTKLQGPPLYPGVSQSVGNVGVGLAWITFQYYFVSMLPEITENIAKSEAYKKFAGKMSIHYIIIIPESYEIALEINEKGIPTRKNILYLDKRDRLILSDDGKAVAVVEEITNSQGDHYYCCYSNIEFPCTLTHMRNSGDLTEDQVKKEYSLYAGTMKSILCDPINHNHALILNCKDYSSLPDDLCHLITKQNKQPPLRIDTSPRNQVTRVAEGLAWFYYQWYLEDIAPGLGNAMRQSKFNRQKEMPAKCFILLPYSCVIQRYLNDAEKESLEHVEQGHWQSIYRISNRQETYYASAFYCGHLQYLHEMETGKIADLTPVQRAAELRIFYEVLHYLFTRPSAPKECHFVKLIYYDDDKQTGRKLSELLMDEIKESLREEQYEGS